MELFEEQRVKFEAQQQLKEKQKREDDLVKEELAQALKIEQTHAQIELT